MAEKATGKKPLQQGVESSILDYYDIMVIGNTGMGKSTTVDKMVLAELVNLNEKSDFGAEPIDNKVTGKLTYNDLSAWLVSDSNMVIRLKNLGFFRSLGDSHLEINRFYKTYHESTLECELLSNESTKIRVLDVPRFFCHKACDNPGEVHTESAMRTMRKILLIKNALNLKFKRVLYFLPQRGPLERIDQLLNMEIQVMKKSFGRTIFDSMVVVVTVPPIIFKFVSAETIIFSEDDFRQTQYHLQKALEMNFESDAPDPPLEFISLFDTCEEVMHKVLRAKVLKPSMTLEFRKSLCARCGVTVVGDGNEASFCTFSDQFGAMPYFESTCHPVMIPKYSIAQKVLGGVLHLATLQKFVGRWPGLESLDEVCSHCNQPPLTPGCMKVGSKYLGADEDGIIVRHSSSTVESYQVDSIEDA